MLWKLCRVVLPVLLGLLPVEAGAVEHPLPARSLVLRTLSGGRGRLVWSIHSRALSAPAANPRLVGGSLRIVGADEDVVVALPAVGWTVGRNGTSLRFANPRAPAGTSPVRLAVLRGSKLTLRAKGAGIALHDRRQGTVAIALTIGDDVYCSRCSAPSVDARGRYRARVCPVPAGCPARAPATTTTTALAELPTTSSATTSQSTTSTTATTSTTLCALVTQWGSLGSGPGELDHPNGIAVSADGTRVYVADAGNDRVVTFDSDGGFLAAIGSRASTGSADGVFLAPADVAVTGDGNLLVLDGGNHRIQKLDANGGFLAKWGGFGRADGAFADPTGFGLDIRGNVYVADWGNNRVQVFDGDGRYLRQWGTAGPGRGQFELPLDVAVHGSRDVLVTEMEGARRVSRFTLLGEIPTGVVSRSLLPSPTQVAVDGHGHVYVADSAWVVRIDDPGLTGVAQTAWDSGGFVYGVATAPGDIVYATDILRNWVQKRSCPR